MKWIFTITVLFAACVATEHHSIESTTQEQFDSTVVQPGKETYVWHNDEQYNYTFEFPSWLSVEMTPTANVKLTDGKTIITTNFIEKPKKADIDEWIQQQNKALTKTLSLQHWTMSVEMLPSIDGTFACRTLAQINDNGALEITLIYPSTTLPYKSKEAFGKVANTATELYLTD